MPDLTQTLADLVSIPSVSATYFDPEPVRHSAQKVAELLQSAGASSELLELEDAHPAVFAEIPGPKGAPTILLYAHHDVQPPGPTEDWDGDPFVPEIADGRLYGRGASDNKAGIMMHYGTILALGESPPVGIKLIIEGEEEVGSAHLVEFLETYQHRLGADVVVIGDSGNWRVGQPALTTSLRGLVAVTIKVSVATTPSHSGLFGGLFPDALMVLSRLIASLHDDQGNISIPGLVMTESPPLDLTEAEVRQYMGLHPGVSQIGSGNLTSRMWTQPAISVLTIDAPPLDQAINQIVPEAGAKISMRIAPGQDPDQALNALRSHLLENVPWGADLSIIGVERGEAFQLETTGTAYDAWRTGMKAAWGVEPTEIGVGGSIPFVAAFSEFLPQAPILLTGAANPTSLIHAPNENQHLGELERCVLAQTTALWELAENFNSDHSS